MKDILAFATVSGFRLEKPTGEEPDRKILPIKAAWGDNDEREQSQGIYSQKRILQKSGKTCLPDRTSEPDARFGRGGRCADKWHRYKSGAILLIDDLSCALFQAVHCPCK